MNGLLASTGAWFSAQPLALDIALGLAKAVFILTLVMLIGGLVLSWVERKQSALMQDRIGANRAALVIPGLGWRLNFWGMVHNVADATKALLKEDFIPPGASKFLHTLAPFLACVCGALAFAVLPFGTSVTVLGREVPLVIAPLEAGVLWVFALLSIGVYGVVLAGYVGQSKFGALGALRGAAQMISYEVCTGLSLLGALLLYQTLDLREMVAWQQAHHWGILLQPLGFLLFLTATIVEMKRIPFDLPEGESEIIGYSVEYSGMKFVLFMMAEFIESLLFAWLISLVFLGGWDLPGLRPAGVAGGEAGFLWWTIPGWLAVALQAASLTAKVTVLCWLQMLIRWSLPRLRYDQVMHLGWKIMLPLALGNLVITAVVALLI